MSELLNKIGENLKPKTEKENEQEIIDKAKEKFFAEGGKVKKTNPASSGRKRTSKRTTGKSKSKKTTAGNNSGSSLLVWAGYGVKVGTKLEFVHSRHKPSKPVYAEVANLGSMQMKLFVDGKQVKIPKPYGVGDGTTDGLVGAEAWVRVHLCKDEKIKAKVKDPKHLNKSTRCLKTSVCEGWDVWTLPYKGKPETIHNRWQRLK